MRAVLDTTDYPTGVKIPDKQMRQLAADGRWVGHDWHGEWNYTLQPEPSHTDAGGEATPRADATAQRAA